MAPLAPLKMVSPREAITDTIHRLLIGLDHNDLETFSDTFTDDDATMEIKGQDVIMLSSRSAIIERVFNPIAPLDTIHQIGNVRIEIAEGGQTASFRSYVWAQHARAGQGKDPTLPKYSVGAEYFVDLVRSHEDGCWRIKKFLLEVIWNDGDSTVMQQPI